MPMRTRTKSSVCRWAFTDLRPLLPASPPADLHLDAPDGQVELVVDDDQAVRVRDAVAAHERRHGLARQVHVGLRDGEREALAADA